MYKNLLYKRVLAIGVIGAMVLGGFLYIFPAKVEASPSVGVKPTAQKLLRIASQDDAKGLNPYAVNDVWSANIIYNVYDGLVSRDWKTQKNQPWVAVGWGLDDNQPPGCDTCNITVEYKLGDWENKWGGPIYFHDGQKVTLDDIIFSYGMTLYNPRWISSVDCIIWDKPWSDPPYGDPSFLKVTIAGKEGWLGIKKANEHTLQFRLVKPYADFFDDTISTIIFPKHIWEKHINIQDGSGDYLTWDMDYNSQTGEAPGLIGTGPFVFDKWLKGQYAMEKKFENVNGHSYFDWTKLPRVDDYGKRLDPEQPAYDPTWTKNHPTPYIDGIVFKIYKTTEAAALAIKSDPPEVDFVAWSIPPSMVSDLQQNPNIQLYYTSEPGFFYTAFNMRRKTFGYEDYAKGNYTDVGKPFRKAIAYSTDKGAIVTQLLQGYGKAALGPVSPDNKIWHNDSLPAYGVNEQLAKKYLDDAGWIDTDGDGWREFPEIGDSQIDMLTPEASYDPIRAVAGQMIATQAQKVGINIKSIPMAFGEIVNRLDQKNFQVYILGWRIGGSDPGYLYNFFHCSQGAGQNYPGYCNAEFDKLMDEYRSIFDKPKRVQLIKDAQGLLVEDLPYNVLYYRTNIEATRKDTFTGWVQGTSGIYTGWSLLLIDSPKTPMLANFVNNRDKILSGDSMDITLQVTEKGSAAPIAGADVQLKIESGTDAARLDVKSGYPGQSDGVTLTGKTDSSGIFKGVFNATAGLTSDKAVSLSALASKEGYTQENTATWEVTVLKVGSKGISIDLYQLDPDSMMAGETSQITVRVVDLMGAPVSGATVEFETTLGTVNPSNTTTDANGKATATFTVSKDASISGEGVKVDIVAKASAVLDGVPVSTSMTKAITVTPYKEPPRPPIPFIDSAVVVLSLLAAAAVFAVILARKKK